MLIKPKAKDDTKLIFAPMGKKPAKKGQNPFAKPDVENAADAKQPGDAKEDAADQKKTKTKKSGSYFAKKAATILAAKK